MSKYYKLKIKAITKETSDAITVHLKQPLFNKVKYTAGQFLTVLIPIDGEKHRRAYSFSSAPTIDSELAFTVKRVKNGLISNYLNDNLKVGQKLEIMEPMGNFTLSPDAKQSRHIVLFGAGSGITPLMSMLKTVLLLEPKSSVSLIYGNRNESSIIFNEKLDWFKNKYPTRFELIHTLNEATHTWTGRRGRIDTNLVKEIASKIDTSKALFFLCGPEGMQEVVQETLLELGFSTNQIRRESFTSSSSASATASDAKTVTIILNGEPHKINVPAGKFILQAGLDSGLDIPFSCQSGICTACRGKCESGEINMNNDDGGLSDSELADGYLLTCVSQPITNDVVIEIG